MKTKTILLTSLLAFSTLLSANEINATQLFETNCAACHITDLSKMSDKSTFIAPPADEIMTHAKEEFGADKAKAVKFMTEYVLTPDPLKSFCASIETFGVMPAQKGIVTEEEVKAIVGMMYDSYPRKAFTEMEAKEGEGHRGMTFEKLDRNKDESITAKEFQLFRADKNHIDPNKFVNTYYFDRLDLNRDGKMDEKEFDIMKADKRRKKQRP
jgi:cytochrome c5